MKFSGIALLLLALALSLPSCRSAAPTASAEKPTGTAESRLNEGWETDTGKSQVEKPRSAATYVSEWLEGGLSEEQIRSKISEGMEDGHFTATAMTEADAEALKKAGISQGLITWMQGLDLPEADASP